jgi:hypothetical protein
MKIKYFLALLVAGMLLVSCSSVKVNYDESVDFSKYKTFAYIKNGISKSKIPRKFKRVIVYEIDEFLKNENLVPDKYRPDLYVKLYIDVHKRYDVYPEPVYYGERIYKTRSYEGKIQVELIDAETKKSVWKGTFSVHFRNTAQLESQMRNYLSKLAEKYPPVK